MTKRMIYPMVAYYMSVRGMNMKEMAAKAHLNRATMTRALNGETRIALADAFAIKDALGCEMEMEELFEERES